MFYSFLFSLMCFGLHAAPPPNDRYAHIQIHLQDRSGPSNGDTWDIYAPIDFKPDVVKKEGIAKITKIEHLSGKSGCSYKTPQNREILFMWMNGVDAAVHENRYPEDFGSVASITCQPYRDHVTVTLVGAGGQGWGPGEVFLDMKNRQVTCNEVKEISQGGEGALCIYLAADGVSEVLRIRTENRRAVTQRGSFGDIRAVKCQPLDA